MLRQRKLFQRSSDESDRSVKSKSLRRYSKVINAGHHLIPERYVESEGLNAT